MPRRKKKSPIEPVDRVCIECPPGTKRPAKYPGPRCATHDRIRRKANKDKSRDSYLKRTYNISEVEFEEVRASQGGTCFICGPITGRNGTSKKLSVDHDHKCCNGSKSCGRCVRALLCTNCNRNILGHLRDDVDALMRAVQVIREHPAQEVLNHDGRRRGLEDPPSKA